VQAVGQRAAAANAASGRAHVAVDAAIDLVEEAAVPGLGQAHLEADGIGLARRPALVRWCILPVMRQCSAMGWPATTRVPAATVLTAVKVVLAKLRRVARSSHEGRVAPVAADSCGSGISTSSLPQAASAMTVRAALHRVRKGKGLIDVSLADEKEAISLLAIIN
jgi:hypothetical protein